MAGSFARTLAALLIVAGGAVAGVVVQAIAGAIAGHALPWRAGALAGAVLALTGLVLRDSWRGRRLMDWLRGPALTSAPAPRVGGEWGELAYRIERALRQREAEVQAERERLTQFLSAIEASPNGVMLLDAGGQIDWLNSQAAEHFGLDPARDLRQHVTHLVRAPAFVAYLQQPRHDEAVVIPGARPRTTLSVLLRHYGDGMQLVLSLDITERERADAMRRHFVANVSHEIRTPLTVLAGFVETLATLPLADAERARVLALMQQQTDRMQALVADLLTLASLEGSPPPPPDRWLSAGDLLARALGDAQALSAGRHAFDAPDDVGDAADVAGSAVELQSAVGNLLANAVRYTPDGGRIALRWRRRADGGAEIEVADTGIGIAREHLPRLTERFYRVDHSRSRDTGGTGLGLAIVKHVAQRHGGEIAVDSAPGQGSTFRLTLPALRVRARRTQDAQGDALPA